MVQKHDWEAINTEGVTETSECDWLALIYSMQMLIHGPFLSMNGGVDGGSLSPLAVFHAWPFCFASAVMGHFTLLPSWRTPPLSPLLSPSPLSVSTSLLDFSLFYIIKPWFSLTICFTGCPVFLPSVFSCSLSVLIPPFVSACCRTRLSDGV